MDHDTSPETESAVKEIITETEEIVLVGIRDITICFEYLRNARTSEDARSALWNLLRSAETLVTKLQFPMQEVFELNARYCSRK